jgi:hypothetical protein
MNRKYITDAIAAILEDIFGFKMSVPFGEEIDSFFEPEQFVDFEKLMHQEFDLPDSTILESATTFRELVVLIEDELFS